MFFPNGLTMSDMKDRLLRSMRANLNHLLDNVREFEERGGLRSVLDPESRPHPQEKGFEEIGGDRGGRAHTPPRASQEGEKTIHDFYANLEVPFDSDLDTVRKSYRRLMRKYHPDNFADDPEQEAMATNLAQELSVAYEAIKTYLKTGRH